MLIEAKDVFLDDMCYNIGGNTMQKQKVDICIDALTECLIDAESGKEVETVYQKVDCRITEKLAEEYRKDGWLFDWSIPQKEGCGVYELFVKGEEQVQGRVAFVKDKGYTYLQLVEAAPQNRKGSAKYIGVGAHLFAIACKHSFEDGNDGYVQFESKTKLIRYYQEKLGAKLIAGNSMYLDTEAALVLVNQYFRK